MSSTPSAPPFHRFLVASAACGALIALCVTGYLVGFRVAGTDPDASIPLPPAASVAKVLPLPTVADQAMDRVVTIEAQRADGQELGTGWLFDQRGDFVTNAHVIEGHLGIRIRDRDARTHRARIIGVDREQDIALIRSLDGFSGAPLSVAMTLDALVPYDVVTVASGRATGHDDVTAESVVQIHQDVPVKGNPAIDPGSGVTTTIYRDMIVMRGSPIYPGNSGGPVLDSRGQVVGIMTLKSKDQPQAFAIPASRVADELRSFATRPSPAP